MYGLREKNLAEKQFFWMAKIGHFGGPGHHVWARMVERGVSNLVLGPGASFVGIGVGPPTESLAVTCKHS